MSERELLNVLLGKAYQISPEKVAEILYKKSDDGTTPTDELLDNAADILLKLDAERMSKIEKVDPKLIYDKAAQEWEGKTHAKWEKLLRASFGVDADAKLKGEELLAAVKAATVKQTEDLPAWEKVKVSKEYLDAEMNWRKQLEEKDAEWGRKVEELQSTFKREKQWQDVSGRIRQAFKALNPVLSQQSDRADAQVDLFVNTHFKEYEFNDSGDGRLLAMKDGKRVEDEHRNPMYLDDLVKQHASRLFDFHAQPPVGNAGNTNDGRQTVKIRFKSEDEFLERYSKATGDEKKELAAAWSAQESQGAGV